MKNPLLIALVAALPMAASAAPITIGFGGTVDNDPYGTALTDFSGQFTYDTDWTDLDPALHTGNYQGTGAGYGIQVSFTGGGSWNLDGQFFMLAILNDFLGIGDEYIAYGTDGGDLFMSLELSDSSATAFGDDHLLTDAPLLSGFDWPRFSLFDVDAELGGMVTSLSCLSGCIPGGGGGGGPTDPNDPIDPTDPTDPGTGGGGGNTAYVPEPGSFALMGLGLAALVRVRGKRIHVAG